MFEPDDWRPSFNAGLLAGEAVALLLVGLVLANRALALKIQTDALALVPAGPRLALFAALWGGLVGAVSHWLGKEHGRSVAGALWMVPLLGIHLQTLLPTARGLLRHRAGLAADVKAPRSRSQGHDDVHRADHHHPDGLGDLADLALLLSDFIMKLGAPFPGESMNPPPRSTSFIFYRTGSS